MKKDDLEKAKEFIKLVNIKIRNSEINDLIIDNINRCINNKKFKIDVNDCGFSFINKKDNEFFGVVFSPSFEEFDNIVIVNKIYEGNHILKENIDFNENIVKINKKITNIYKYYDNNKLSSINKENTESIYLDNCLVYKIEKKINMGVDIEKEGNMECIETSAYILPNRKCALRKIKISDDDFSNISYFETNSFEHPNFNDKDQRQKVFMYVTNSSNKKHYEAMEKKVLELINPKENVKIKK